MAKSLPDPIRGKRVAATPEEHVRQGLVRFLIDRAGIPKVCLRTELSLRHFDPQVNDRVDVAAFHAEQPVLLCECKAPEIVLGPEVSAQLRRYLRLLPAPWVLATNGHDFRLHHFREGTWEACAGLVPWPRMVAGL